MTRKLANTDVLKRFDALLRDYYENGLQMRQGIPGVQYCADKLCMSTNYFGDLIKKMTGDTARDYIRNFVVQHSKNMLAAGKVCRRRLMTWVLTIRSTSAGCSKTLRE